MNKKLLSLFTCCLAVTSLVACGNNTSLALKGKSNNNPSDYDAGFKSTCNTLLGEVIPFLPCVTYEYEFSTDEYGDPFLAMYYSYIAEETADRAYLYLVTLCQEAGYTTQSGYYSLGDSYYAACYYADKIVKPHQGIEIIIMEAIVENVPMVGAFATTYLYEDPAIFPSIAVEKLLGKNLASVVPTIVGSQYTYSFKFSREETDEYIYNQVRIVVYNVGVEEEEQFFKDCRKNDFYIVYDSDDDMNVLKQYPGYTGEAFCAYHYDVNDNFDVGIYFLTSVYTTYNVFIMDVFTIQWK